MSQEEKWKERARFIFEEEKRKVKLNHPLPQEIILSWRGEFYLGYLQEIASELPEIVLLSKTTKPIDEELKKAILEIQPERLVITTDYDLNPKKRGHILRRVCSKLTGCTPEQIRYLLEHPPQIIEVEV